MPALGMISLYIALSISLGSITEILLIVGAVLALVGFVAYRVDKMRRVG